VGLQGTYHPEGRRRYKPLPAGLLVLMSGWLFSPAMADQGRIDQQARSPSAQPSALARMVRVDRPHGHRFLR